MRRIAKVAAIFNELNAVNDDYSSLELMEAAEALLEFAHPDHIGPAANDAEYSTSFDRWSLDAAFADEGWLILCRRGQDYSAWEEEEIYDPREPLEALGLAGGFR